MNTIYNKWIENLSVAEQQELEMLPENEKKLIFEHKLSFGTGGVRAKMGLGPSLLNIYTIAQITMGYAKYLKDNYSGDIKIILGRDSRNNGELFTQVVTTVLEEQGIKVCTFEDIIPTPVVSYMVRLEKAQGAIILTASHNPKEYNGYKVYNDSGAQLNLIEAASLIEYVNVQEVNFNLSTNDQQPFKIYSQTDIDQYLKDISFNDNNEKNLKIVFTPIHGTTYQLIPAALKQNGYKNVTLVKEQINPDGDFPTTISANPEEQHAFEYANKYLLSTNSDIAIATDPDGDRIGIVCNEHGNLISFTGNEIGALLINYLVETKQYKPNSIIYKTIVTGDLGATIAKASNISVEETLTGFKFIGEKIELEKNKEFLFGYEESYGYLFNPKVRDKDSIQSAIYIANMVNYYKNKQLTLSQKLNEIKQTHGYYNEQTFAYTCSSQTTITKVMEYARNTPGKLFGYQPIQKIDYLIDETGLPKSDVVKYYFKDMWIVFRPSGTEPKIKFYVSVKENSSDDAKIKIDKLKLLIDNLVNELSR